MIKVIRQGYYSIPDSFQKQLKLIDPSLFAAWDPIAERILILSHGPAIVFGRESCVIEDVVCDEKMGFRPADNRALERLRLAKLEMNDEHDSFLIKRAREKKEKRVKAFKLYLQMKKEFYKKFHKLWKTRTIDLGGANGRIQSSRTGNL